MGQVPQHRRERRGRAAQLEHLALEHVDHVRVGDPARLGEHRGLGLVDVLLQRAAHDDVGVDDRVEHGVQHRRTVRARAGRDRARAAARTACSPPCSPCRTVMHEVAADEDHHLAGLDHLGGAAGQRVVVVHRLDDDEQRVVVRLELGPLVGVDRRPRRPAGAARTARRCRRTARSFGSCRPIQTNPSPVRSTSSIARASRAGPGSRQPSR